MRFSVVCATSLVLALASPVGAEEAFELDALLARMASTRGVSAQFRELREVALLVEPLESRGALYFVPPDRMARFTIEPAPAALLVEGESLRFRAGAGEPEMDLSSSPIARAFVDNFMAVFAGDRARLEGLYRAELRGALEGWELALTPRSPTLARFLEVVLLRGDASGMREMEIRDADGDRTLTQLESVDHDRSFTSAELDKLFRDGAPLAPTP
jgi:hypothetical protein